MHATAAAGRAHSGSSWQRTAVWTSLSPCATRYASAATPTTSAGLWPRPSARCRFEFRRSTSWASRSPYPEAILEHDESFFFSCYRLLTAALWFFGKRGNLRRVATALLPFIVTAELATIVVPRG